MYCVFVCAGAVHSLRRGLFWLQPGLRAGNWFPRRPVWSILWLACCISETETMTSLLGGKAVCHLCSRLFTECIAELVLSSFIRHTTWIKSGALHTEWYFYSHSWYQVSLKDVLCSGGPLLTLAHGPVWEKTLSRSTCTCSEATTPSARSIHQVKEYVTGNAHITYCILYMLYMNMKSPANQLWLQFRLNLQHSKKKVSHFHLSSCILTQCLYPMEQKKYPKSSKPQTQEHYLIHKLFLFWCMYSYMHTWL